MLLTFCGASYGIHRKKGDKVVPTTVDLCYQNMGVVDSSNQVMYSYAFEWGENHGKKDLLTCLLMNSYILYKLTVGHSKTRLEFIKDITDSLVSDYKETEAVSVARNHGTANLPGKKEKDYIVCSDWNNPSIGHQRSRAVRTKCHQGVHANCFLKYQCL